MSSPRPALKIEGARALHARTLRRAALQSFALHARAPLRAALSFALAAMALLSAALVGARALHACTLRRAALQSFALHARAPLRAALSFALAAMALLSASVVVAAPPDAPAPSAPTAPTTLLLVLQPDTEGLDTAALIQAIERELGVSVKQGAPAAADTLSLDWVSSPGHVVATFIDAAGRRTARTITRPEPSAAPEVLALLAGNLVRNEAQALLAELAAERARGERAGAEGAALAGAGPAKSSSKASSGPAKAGSKASAGEAARGSLTQPEALPLLRRGSWHLSLFYPLGLDPNSETLSVAVELGLLYSHVGEARALSFNPLVSRHQLGASGLHLAGLVAWAGGEVHGAQVGGLVVGSRQMSGFSLGGGLAYAEGESVGAQIGGLVSVVGGPLHGLQLSGGFSYAGAISGAQLTGGANVARGAAWGLQLGSVNVAQRVAGAQIGAVNAASTSDGAQVGVVSVADQAVGAQVGAVNVARRVSGFQLGAVNVAEEVDGLAIGLVSLAKNGRQQPTAWVSAGQRSHLGVSLEVGPVYSVPYVGADLWGEERRLEWGYHLGVKARVGRVWGAVDGGYGAEQERLDATITPLERARALVGVEVVPRAVTLFAGVGTRTSELKHFTVESHFGVQVF